MSPPIYTPDGSEVSEIVLPDGSTASEVIGPDGNVVFEAGPDIPDSELPQTQHRWVIAEGAGTTWVDNVGSENATANFENWVEGNWIGDYKVELNGSSDKADTGAVIPSGSVWLSATVDRDTIPGNREYINSARDGQTNGGVFLQFNNDGTWRFGLYHDGTFTSASTPSASGTHRLVGYADAANNEVGIAVDGTIESTTAVTSDFSEQLPAGFHGLGYDRAASATYLSEGLDNCGIGAAAPTSTEIQADYDSQPWS